MVRAWEHNGPPEEPQHSERHTVSPQVRPQQRMALAAWGQQVPQEDLAQP